MKKHTLSAVMIISLMLLPITAFAVDIDYPDFSDLSDFTLGVNAQQLNTVPDDILQLSSGTWQRSGYAFLTNRIQLENSFNTHFTFRIDNNVGGGDSDGLGADWLMFLIKRNIGYFENEDVAVEFDIFNNGARDNYSGNHVGINYGGQFVTTQHIDERLNDGDVWHAWIDYDGIILKVYISLNATKPASPVLTHAIDISAYFSDIDPYIGFQAASGAYGADFSILSWSFESPSSAFIVALDIKPGSCPNPLNLKKQGALPVAILGSADFDVSQLDIASLRLEGVPPHKSSFEDVGTPFYPPNGKVDCFDDCTDENQDGYIDLILKFDPQEILYSFGSVQKNECLLMTITGNLLDEFGGNPVSGEDVVIIRKD